MPEIERVDSEAFGVHAYGLMVLTQLFDVAQEYFFVAETDGIVGYVIGAPAVQNTRACVEGWILSSR